MDIESLQLLGGLSADTDWKGQAVPARTDGVAMVPIRIQALYLSVYNHGQAATKLLDFVPHSAVGGPAMTVKIDGVEPNIYPAWPCNAIWCLKVALSVGLGGILSPDTPTPPG